MGKIAKLLSWARYGKTEAEARLSCGNWAGEGGGNSSAKHAKHTKAEIPSTIEEEDEVGITSSDTIAFAIATA
jgi:hypothetical protein